MVLLLATSAMGDPALVPLQVETFVTEPDRAVTLNWKVTGHNDLKPFTCQATDYRGAFVANLTGSVAPNGTASVTGTFKPGYYELVTGLSAEKFGVIAIHSSTKSRDPFFCIDAGLSWLQPSEQIRASYIQILARCGIDVARERVSWRSVNPSLDRHDWQGDRHYQTLRELYLTDGLKILELFHDAPPWTGFSLRNPYPQDLVKSAQAWAKIGKAWDPYWGGIEIWNEPDIMFGGNLPADQYAATAKAISYGLAAAGVKAPRGGGVFTDSVSDDFRGVCARSGLLDAVDFISFHSYQPSTFIETQVESYRDWLAGVHQKSIPLWITECGWPWEGQTDRPQGDQDRISALEITSKAVEAKACGIARYFPFVFPDYREGQKNFGMMAKNGTPLRSFAAYAQCIRALTNKSYLGDLKAGDPLIKRSRIFGDDQVCVAVLYTGQIKELAVKLPLPADRIEGIDGRILEQRTDGFVSIPDGLVYLFFKRFPADSLLQRDTRAMALCLAARDEHPAGNQPHPIVIQNLPDLARNQFSERAYNVSEPDIDHYPLLLRVNNLSTEKLLVNITLGKPAMDGAVDPVEGYGQNVEVNGQSFCDIPFGPDLRKFGPAPWIAIDVVGRSKSGAILDTLEIPFHLEENMVELLQTYSWKTRLTIEQIDSWQKNIVSDGRMVMTAGTDKPWRLEVQFGRDDPWVYPIFKLSPDLDLSRAKGVVIRARCEHTAQVRLILREKRGRQYVTSDAIIPSDGQWHAVMVQFADLVPLLTGAAPANPNEKLDLGQVREVMVGMNSKAQNNVLEVSDLYAVGM